MDYNYGCQFILHVTVITSSEKMEGILIQTANNYARILKFLSDNFGTDFPDERVRGCLEIVGSFEEFELTLHFLESKQFIDVVAAYNPRTGKMLNCPVLKEKTQRMIKIHGIEEVLFERVRFKW